MSDRRAAPPRPFSSFAVARVAAAVVAAVALVVGTVTASSGPASAAGTVEARGVALASSASCLYGDVDITYTAAGAADASVSFTAVDGSVLAGYSGAAHQRDFSGTEHVLTEADEAAPEGTVLGIYVWVGSAPPAASSTAEFFVLYRCDAFGDDEGGTNEVLSTCLGPFGTCPRTAEEALNPSTSTTSTTSPAVPTTVDDLTGDGLAIPRYTG